MKVAVHYWWAIVSTRVVCVWLWMHASLRKKLSVMNNGKKSLLCYYKFFKQEDHVLVQPSVLVIVAGFFCCDCIQMASGKMGKRAQARPSQGCVTVLIAALVYRLCEMWRDDKTFHLGLRLWLEHKSVSHSESPALAPSEALCGDIEWLEPLVCGGCVLLAEMVHVFSGLQLILMLEFGCAH